jgi:ankyrin repeat protein
MMDQLPLEILIHIAQYVDLSDMFCWMRIATRYHTALKDELCTKALDLDQKTGWPYFVVRAALLNRVSDSFKALLQGTKIEDINSANVDVKEIPGKYAWTSHIPPFILELRRRRGPSENTSLLHTACQMCHEDVVKSILAHGADVTVNDAFGWAPLHLAAWAGRDAIIQLLLNFGAEVDVKVVGPPNTFEPNSESTPLHHAIAQSHVSSMDLLLKAGADPKATRNHNPDALSIAAQKGNMEILRRILEFGYNKEALSTALSFAAQEPNIEPLKLLLNNGAEPHVALSHAARFNRLDNLKLLIASGGDVRHQASDILYSLRSAEAARMVLGEASGLSASARPGMWDGTPIEVIYDDLPYRTGDAAYKDLEELILLLIEDGCPIRVPKQRNPDNDRDPFNRNIFHDAAHEGHIRVMQTLFEKKRSLFDFVFDDGDTALHSACLSPSENKLACIKFLVEKGANIYAVNNSHQTVLDMVYIPKYQTPSQCQANGPVTRYLISQGISIDSVPPQKGRPPLINALDSGNDTSAVVLMEAGADIYATGPVGWTTLQIAAQNGCVESMNHLLQNGDKERLMGNRTHGSLLQLAVIAALNRYKEIKGYGAMMAHILLGHVDVAIEEVVDGDDTIELEHPAHTGHIKVIRRLCRRQIDDPGFRGDGGRGMTAFDWIKRNSPAEVTAKMIEEADQRWPVPEPWLPLFLRRHGQSQQG